MVMGLDFYVENLNVDTIFGQLKLPINVDKIEQGVLMSKPKLCYRNLKSVHFKLVFQNNRLVIRG